MLHAFHDPVRVFRPRLFIAERVPSFGSKAAKTIHRLSAGVTRGHSRRPPIEVAMADIIQVALRGTRKEFFLNSRNLWLKLRDPVIVQTEHGEAFGSVFLKDQTLVLLKRPGTVTREIIRKAEEEDLDQEDHNRDREREAFEYCKERIESRDLKMDL